MRCVLNAFCAKPPHRVTPGRAASRHEGVSNPETSNFCGDRSLHGVGVETRATFVR